MPLRLPALHRAFSLLCPYACYVLRSPATIASSTTIALLLVSLPIVANARPTGLPSPDRPQPTSSQPTLPATLLEPKTAKDFNQRGTSKAQNGDLEGAIADFSQAVQLKRDYVTAYYNRGVAYASTGNARAALADYTQVIALKPNNAAARYTRGSLRANTGDRAGAIVDLQQAATLFRQQLNVTWQQKALDKVKQLQQP